MGYLGMRSKYLPIILNKYLEEKIKVLELSNALNDLELQKLYDEFDEYWSECELYDKDDYPDSDFTKILPQKLLNWYKIKYDWIE